MKTYIIACVIGAVAGVTFAGLAILVLEAVIRWANQ